VPRFYCDRIIILGAKFEIEGRFTRQINSARNEPKILREVAGGKYKSKFGDVLVPSKVFH
jgi:hypothetical protein